jgi:large subunit ribosomal protein L31e
MGVIGFRIPHVTHDSRLSRQRLLHKSKQMPQVKEPVTREYTIHLHKHVHGQYLYIVNHDRTFRKRAPTAIKVIRSFAQKMMGTADVRLDPQLNKALWERGIKTVPHRLRVRIARKPNDSEEATDKFYSYVTFVPVANFKGLQTVTVEQE